jgi:DNA-binding NtrC family response regulator
MPADKSTRSIRIPAPDGVIGNSVAMQDVYRLLELAAKSSTAVLILGEIGTGKSFLARALHQSSARNGQAFFKLDCGALGEDHLEQSLFGQGESKGLLEQAKNGTLFLNEIQSLPIRLQSRLLEAMENGCFQRMGNSISVPNKTRLIAASSQDLHRAVLEARFREELFWKLSVLPIALPPLRRREGDIELLANHFLKYFADLHQRSEMTIEPTALKALKNYPWPGNIRELQNYIERGVVLSQSDQLTVEHLPQTVVGDSKAAQTAVFRPTDEQSLIREFVYNRISKSEEDAEDLHKQIVEPVERELLLQIMEACQQTQTKAASRLGINRNTLYKKLVEFGLTKMNSNSGESE